MTGSPAGKPVSRDDSRPRILVIDDEPGILKTLQLGLERAGFHVTALDNGEAAVAQIKQIGFAAVVTDIFLPGIDGLELLNLIKQLSPHTKVIAISAGGTYSASPFALTIAQKMKADRVIPKPFKVEDLVAAVIELLANG